MSEQAFDVKIITPTGEALSTKAIYLRLPGKSGEIGVLANHTQTISILSEGPISYDTPNGEEKSHTIQEGIAHINPDSVLILTPSLT